MKHISSWRKFWHAPTASLKEKTSALIIFVLLNIIINIYTGKIENSNQN
jgi:hypothetical protein